MVAVWWWKIYYQHWNLGPGYFCPPIGSRIGAGEICDICFEWGTVGVVIPFPLGGNKHQLRHNLFTFPIIILNEPLGSWMDHWVFYDWLSCFPENGIPASPPHVMVLAHHVMLWTSSLGIIIEFKFSIWELRDDVGLFVSANTCRGWIVTNAKLAKLPTNASGTT